MGYSFAVSGNHVGADAPECVTDCRASVPPSECVGVGYAAMGMVGTGGNWATTNECPAGCQPAIDTMYHLTCAGGVATVSGPQVYRRRTGAASPYLLLAPNTSLTY